MSWMWEGTVRVVDSPRVLDTISIMCEKDGHYVHSDTHTCVVGLS